MNTAVINVRVEPSIKRDAKKVADTLGFSLSGLINAYLRHFIRTKTVTFSAAEEPSAYMIRALKESKEDIKHGRVSPSFSNAKNAIAWLDKEDPIYDRSIRGKI